ncbi:hypothetical protein J6590_053101 [Homalodisca vitripennis]|nr:hypothetical protein J6590_053101 [Homalodisca vitripennis]
MPVLAVVISVKLGLRSPELGSIQLAGIWQKRDQLGIENAQRPEAVRFQVLPVAGTNLKLGTHEVGSSQRAEAPRDREHPVVGIRYRRGQPETENVQ